MLKNIPNQVEIIFKLFFSRFSFQIIKKYIFSQEI